MGFEKNSLSSIETVETVEAMGVVCVSTQEFYPCPRPSQPCDCSTNPSDVAIALLSLLHKVGSISDKETRHSRATSGRLIPKMPHGVQPESG
jgi:hypothetical protein